MDLIAALGLSLGGHESRPPGVCRPPSDPPPLPPGLVEFLNGIPRVPLFDAERVRVETQVWRVSLVAQIEVRMAFEQVGIPYPASTRAQAVEAVRRIATRRLLARLPPGLLAELSRGDTVAATDVDPLVRYMLDAVRSRTLTGSRSSTGYLIHRLYTGLALADRQAREPVGPVGEDEVRTLARCALLRIAPTASSPGNAALVRILERERWSRVRPHPAEVSHVEVRVEAANRVLFSGTGVAYPPRTRADVIEMLRQTPRRYRPMDPAEVEELGDTDAALAPPWLAGYESYELCLLLARPAQP